MAAVRRGLRSAFSFASRPTGPNARGYQPAIARTSGPAMTGASSATPTNTPTIPPPTTQVASGTSANKPTSIAAAPRSSRTPPMRRWRLRAPSGSTTSSRMAATGGTFAARRAGR